MHHFTRLSMISCFVLLMLGSLVAQQTKISVVRTVEHADGTIDILSRTFTDEASADAFVAELDKEDVPNSTLSITHNTVTERDAEQEDQVWGSHSYSKTSQREQDSNKKDCNKKKYSYNYDYNYNYNYNYAHSPSASSKAFFGIYPRTADQGGVLLTDVSRNAGAEAAGMLPGDVIVRMAGEDIKSHSDFSRVLAEHEPGERVDVAFLRNGTLQNVEVLLTDKSKRNYVSRERDPCKVFIGIRVSNTGYREDGVHITSIIDDTPAFVSEMQAGDIVTAMDGIRVQSFYELLAERNKHNPGDRFVLDIIRDGQNMQVNAQFKQCEEPVAPAPAPPAPPTPPAIVDTPVQPEAELVVPEFDNTLPTLEWRVFPNPTVSRVNVQFRAEAQPTTVQIIDATGKVLYRENIIKFDGQYNKEINLPDAVPGGVFLQVIQGDLIKVEKIVLLDRA